VSRSFRHGAGPVSQGSRRTFPGSGRLVDRAGIGVTLVLALSGALAAHDIPNDVTIQAFLKPEGSRLRLLVRVPLSAMRDINYPRREREFVDLARADPMFREAAVTWIASDVVLYDRGVRLTEPRVLDVRPSLLADDSFRTYETALAHLTGPPLPADTAFVWNQGLLDVLLEYPMESEGSELAIDPHWGRLGLRTVTALRFLPPGGAVRAFELFGDPGLVRLDPRWHQAAARFVRLGFTHILDGTDHLLFLLCLVIPFRRFRSLVFVVTAFTVAHSIALIASAYDFAPTVLWFPPLVETLIAASIVYMALENIVAVSVRRRWALAFAFGLIHGFGFSFALKQTLQFAGTHLLTSLLSFNLGVELGQLLVLAIVIPVLGFLFRFVVAERIGAIIVSALVAHTGWHWMIERADRLRQYSFEWPSFSPVLLLFGVRMLMAVLIVGGVAWLLRVVRQQRKEPGAVEE
jgi:HupE / UreJ protein